MKSYDVEIKETLCMTVTVEADSLEQAEEKVSDEWKNSEYILDADHFKSVDFKAKPANWNKEYER